MPLPKHLRPRWRYLAVGIEAWPDADLSRAGFQGAVWGAARSLLGDPGSADADLRVMQFAFDDGTGEAVLRVRRDEVGPARAAIACVDEIEGDPVGVWVRGVSGTIRACEEKYIGGSPDDVSHTEVVLGNDRRSAVVRGDRVDVRTGGDTFTGATLQDLEEH